MRIKIQFENGKEVIFEEALIDNVRRLKVIQSDYPDILDYYAGYLGNFRYFERPSDCDYLDGKSKDEIANSILDKKVLVYHKSGRNSLIRHKIKHLWLKNFWFWRQVF